MRRRVGVARRKHHDHVQRAREQRRARWYAISCDDQRRAPGDRPADRPPSRSTRRRDFAANETCTVTDPRFGTSPIRTRQTRRTTWRRTTTSPSLEASLRPWSIHEIQGASHLSAPIRRPVPASYGIVTATRANGYYIQDPNPDANDATSEGLFVFTSTAPTRERRRRGARQRDRGRVPTRRRQQHGPHHHRDHWPDDDRALDRQPAARRHGDRHRRPRSAERGDRGRRGRSVETQRRASTRSGRHRLLREPRGDAASRSNNPVVDRAAQQLRRDLRDRRQRRRRWRTDGPGRDRHRDLGRTARRLSVGDFDPERIQLDDAVRIVTPNAHVGDGFTSAGRRRPRLQLRQLQDRDHLGR